MIPLGLWDEFIKLSSFKSWQISKEPSYIIDMLVNSLYDDYNKNPCEKRLFELKQMLNKLSSEDRARRTILAELYEEAVKKRVRARLIPPFKNSEHGYVLVPVTQSNIENISIELQMRCHVARYKLENCTSIIGIAIYRTGDDFTFQYSYLEQNELDQEFIDHAELLEKELGLFKNLRTETF